MKGLYHRMPIVNVVLLMSVKKIKNAMCFIFALLVLSGIFLTASADGDGAAEIEEIADVVAEKEAATAAAAAEAEAEAKKVNDVVDMDAKSEDASMEETSTDDIPTQEINEASGLSGPVLAMAVGIVLIVSGLGVVAASNKKIKAGKKAKSVK